MIANLIFFYFIYTLLKGYLYKNIFHLKNLLIFSILLGLSATSFFFIFLVLSLTLVLFLAIEFKLDLYNILRKNYKNIFISLVLFLFIILPFFYLIINSNPEYMRRMGVYEIGATDKTFLIEYYFQKIFRLKLIIIYIFLLFSYFLMKKFNYFAFQYIGIFYILFFSSIISPILFILFSSKIAFLYHFNNMVVVFNVINNFYYYLKY